MLSRKRKYKLKKRIRTMMRRSMALPVKQRGARKRKAKKESPTQRVRDSLKQALRKPE